MLSVILVKGKSIKLAETKYKTLSFCFFILVVLITGFITSSLSKNITSDIAVNILTQLRTAEDSTTNNDQQTERENEPEEQEERVEAFLKEVFLGRNSFISLLQKNNFFFLHLSYKNVADSLDTPPPKFS